MSITPNHEPLPRHLLGIWPHPDDEAYLSAGLMARVVEAGGSVTVLTLTRGEKGTADPNEFDQEHFAIRREHELRAALTEIGVDDVRVGPFRDGECDLVEPETAISLIADTIRAVDPGAIATFGPDGITGHLDHRTVSAWVTEAWRRTGRDAELLYATMSDEFVVANVPLHDRIGLFAELAGGPASQPTSELARAYALDEVELNRKRTVLRRHASQTEPLAELIGEATYRAWWHTEWFRRPSPMEADTCAVCRPTIGRRDHEVPA